MWLTSGELNESSIGPEAGAAGAKLKRVANSGTGDGRRPELATNARLCQSEQKPHTVLQEAFVHAFTCLGVCVVVVLSCCVSGCRREPQGGVPICARVLHVLVIRESGGGMRCSRWPGCPVVEGILRALRASRRRRHSAACACGFHACS